MTDDYLVNQIQRGRAFCYFNPDNLAMKKKYRELVDRAWKEGLSESYCLNKNKPVTEMTELEIRYIFRDLI